MKAMQYDNEFLMADGEYREIGSCSNLTDFQPRRLNIKYITKRNEREYVHALNNTAMPTSRGMLAIIENHQQEDGSIKIPKALQKYMNNKKELEALK